MIARRLITIPVCLLLTLLLTLLLPVLLPVAAVLALFPGYRGALATLLFVTGYAWCETIGIFSALYMWLRRRRDREAYLTANYRLQYWWTATLKSLAQRFFRLQFHVFGEESLDGPPALVLPRHASIADTIIPMVYYAIPRGVRLRYVLKRELLLDPCLDIVGNRLPNYFAERSGIDSERERRGVAELISGLGPNEGALIYPEGTRFSVGKREALRRRYTDDHEMLAELARWHVLLPPRLGGTLAMLEANPRRDLLFLAHAGFEGSSHFTTLLNGSWLGASIRIRFWRIPYAEIPTERNARVDFLFAQWDRMQEEVLELAGLQ